MSTVVNKRSFEVIEHANTPEYDPAEWLINPDLSRVRGVDKKYWYIKDGQLHEMDADLKRKLDDASLGEIKAKAIQQVEEETRLMLSSGFEFPAMSGKHICLSNEDRMMLQGIVVLGMEAEAIYPITIREIGGGARRLLSKNDVASLVQSDIAHKLRIKKQEDEIKTKILESLSAEKAREAAATRRS